MQSTVCIPNPVHIGHAHILNEAWGEGPKKTTHPWYMEFVTAHGTQARSLRRIAGYGVCRGELVQLRSGRETMAVACDVHELHFDEDNARIVTEPSFAERLPRKEQTVLIGLNTEWFRDHTCQPWRILTSSPEGSYCEELADNFCIIGRWFGWTSRGSLGSVELDMHIGCFGNLVWNKTKTAVVIHA